MTESALTLTDLQTRFSDESDDTNSEVLTKVIRWLNDCQYRVLVGKRYSFLRTSTTLSISATTAQATLPTDFDEEDVVYDTTNNKVLTYQESNSVIIDDPDSSESSGTSGADRYFFPSSGTIQVREKPTSALTLTLAYWKLPTALSSGTDTSNLPNEFRVRVLVSYALWRYFKFKDDTRANEYKQDYIEAVLEMQAKHSALHSLEDLGLMSDYSSSGRPELSAKG